MQRHYGLDWLRIGAFAILILYHVGMVFVPWDFHAKLPGAWWVAVPMMASNPWRLALLFLVSGYASRALMLRNKAPWRFARQRSLRLLVPLIVGVAVIVPVQPWVELREKYGYPHGFGHFWLHDYFQFTSIGTLFLPAWNHLWFVGYLWVYTLALAAGALLIPQAVRRGAQAGFAAMMRGPALLIVPIGWMVVVNFVLFPGARETHALVDDWVAHASYFPFFLFGYALACAPHTLAALVRRWKASAAIAVVAYALVAGIEIRWPGSTMPRPWGTVFALARAVEAWGAVAALIGYADGHWNRDRRWRRTLTEAVFPFYIVHQSIIVLVAYWLLPLALPGWAAFAVLVTATIAGCWAFYLIGRRIGPLRPLIGLRRHASRRTHVDPRPAIM
ncbi:acyltransferase family protein [uncultured Sphingomonas sp.]|uniref:acyltransferase family protein n=1 Tax=uncultured Sphingomonas sp. TaxID=158754 RepID=UPI0025EDF5BD|nr:acyltransferase family protein [uncultured Sphingomonas sp.]